MILEKNSSDVESNSDLEKLNPEAKAIVTHFSSNQDLRKKNPYRKPYESLGLKSNEVPKPKKPSTFKFIDLFAGIGGFRTALQNLDGRCMFTSEWDLNAKKSYYNNYGEYPFGDITKPEVKSYIPEGFDALCAGFPCQPFSKGGYRNGFEDTRGTLFFDICEIVQKHQPKYLLLENVANMVTHDKGNTYKVILKSLDELGYYFPDEPLLLSPDAFGVPILRPRIFIPCVRKDVANGNIDKIKQFKNEIAPRFISRMQAVDDILNPDLPADLPEYEERVLGMWDAFYKGIDLKVIGFPIWMEFFKYEGALDEFPLWKAKFIQKNIDLYNRNKEFIDSWLFEYDNLEWCIKTHRKMEWQAGKDISSVFEGLIQFRPSGVRVKRPNRFSTLVAMNHQQIIGKYRRRITIDESKKLQSFPDDFKLSSTKGIALKQLGNSVNVKVVETIFDVILKNFA
ncbi:DNA cytosine methyltransferase [Urechidicola vernalis]|uniref:Cytosine-specific methyltransferase n=1 Tax=Urechidicola vernalis TaxID=3075600 RepID=A0ABU2Y7K2_9FLAO|nr:DNA cytosine methyltransferase [Urechidicola sp. P050]MDT0554179.1 DNA cytosine methyltransferase [Urechidicola sp. P050]